VGTLVALVQPGYVIWHLDVLYVAATAEYWARYAAFPVGAHCSASDLFVARSLDGQHWEHADRPLLGRGRLPWASASLYRGTLWYDAPSDVVHLLFSGRSAENVWSLGAAAYRLADLRRAIPATAAAPQGPVTRRGAVRLTEIARQHGGARSLSSARRADRRPR
jgi:hypothetical protein